MQKSQLMKPIRKNTPFSSKKKWTTAFIVIYYLLGRILSETFHFSTIENYFYCFIPISIYVLFSISKRIYKD